MIQNSANPVRSRVLYGSAVLVGALVLAAIFGLNLGGGAAPSLLSDPGALVRWGLPLIRGVSDLATAVAIGALLMAVLATGNGSWQLRRLLNVAAIAATVWTTTAIVTELFTYLSITGLAISPSKQFGNGFWLFVSNIALGQSLGLNILAGAVVAILAIAAVGLRSALLALIFAFAGLVPLAVSGHAAGTDGHSMAVNALGLHLVGISVWVGGLVALLALRSGGATESHLAAKRYSSVALFAYFIVAASGIAAASVRVHSIGDLATAYGQIVVLKSAILLGLGAIGAWYRLRLLQHNIVRFWRIVLLELVLMGFAMGLATALARTKPPQYTIDLSNPTPAQILTGQKLPPELTMLRWVTSFNIDLVWLLVSVLGIVLYSLGVWRLHRRGDKWPIARTLSWVAGMLALGWITSGAMNVYEQYLFSVHMISHMMLTMAVPVLLVPGAPITLLSRAVAARTDATRGVREWVLWAVHTPYAQLVANPFFAAINFAGSLVVFYFTPMFSWATRDHLGHEWMIVHFLITGYLFVQSLVGIDPGPKPINFPVRLIILLGTLTFHALFGLSLMMGSSLLLADWFGAMGRTWGQSPLMDQQTGGGIAWGIGEFPAGILTLMVSMQWAKSDARDAKRLDRASDRSGNKDVEAYNQMLEQMAKRRALAEQRHNQGGEK